MNKLYVYLKGYIEITNNRKLLPDIHFYQGNSRLLKIFNLILWLDQTEKFLSFSKNLNKHYWLNKELGDFYFSLLHLLSHYVIY